MRSLHPGDPNYPALLGAIPSPPPLYVRGTVTADDALALAVVGARAATPYGVEVAERLAGELAARGVTIVSGLARGIDAAAHRGALGARGRTLAVLGCGIDVVYPPENRALARHRSAGGARVAVRGRRAGAPRPLPRAQPHARRTQPRRRRGRGGRAERRPDHRGFRGRSRARSVRRSRQNHLRDEWRNEPAHPGRC